MSAAGCIFLPVPWFPENPFEQTLADLLSRDGVTRRDVLLAFGEPWANWDDRAYIHITDRPSSYLVGGTTTGGGGALEMSHRDFVLMITFDRDGLMNGHEQFSDTGERNHCFSNGICFSRETGNLPHRPPDAIGFRTGKLSAEVCTLNLYRATDSPRATYDDYVDVYLEPRGPRDDGAELHERADRSGVSVWVAGRSSNLLGRSMAGGLNRWYLQPNTSYRLKFGFPGANDYPFTVSTEQGSRSAAALDLRCDAGEVRYVRLLVPKSLEDDVDVQLVADHMGAEATRDLPVLLPAFR